jgi:ribosomal protein S18 acetylase RimI-like enzyme
MSPILTDLSPEAVIPAMEANLSELPRVFGQSPMTVLHDTPALLWSLTGVPHPAFNGVVRTHLKPEDIDQTIEETLARFKAREVPMMWLIGPSTRPTGLGARLRAHGFTQEDRPGIGAEDLGMAVDLLALNEPLPAPDGLTIQPVQDEAGCRLWNDVARGAFEVSQEVADSCFRLYASLLPQEQLRHSVGFLNGEPVATCSLLLGGGVAGLYTVGTIPEGRRRGFGTAMVLEALRAARAMGYRVGILMAAPMGVSVYRRIGFTEYCRFGAYFWLGGEDAPAAAA